MECDSFGHAGPLYIIVDPERYSGIRLRSRKDFFSVCHCSLHDFLRDCSRHFHFHLCHDVFGLQDTVDALLFCAPRSRAERGGTESSRRRGRVVPTVGATGYFGGVHTDVHPGPFDLESAGQFRCSQRRQPGRTDGMGHVGEQPRGRTVPYYFSIVAAHGIGVSSLSVLCVPAVEVRNRVFHDYQHVRFQCMGVSRPWSAGHDCGTVLWSRALSYHEQHRNCLLHAFHGSGAVRNPS
mmetsp:Transcript_796/g.1818  ORF Transcript_796/g.1818 Transcript_796/m.1818 type:complete len:237 (+) Transcript_796:304-1014(+)